MRPKQQCQVSGGIWAAGSKLHAPCFLIVQNFACWMVAVDPRVGCARLCWESATHAAECQIHLWTLVRWCHYKSRGRGTQSVVGMMMAVTIGMVCHKSQPTSSGTMPTPSLVFGRCSDDDNADYEGTHFELAWGFFVTTVERKSTLRINK
jgi:hypothetical protein